MLTLLVGLIMFLIGYILRDIIERLTKLQQTLTAIWANRREEPDMKFKAERSMLIETKSVAETAQEELDRKIRGLNGPQLPK